MISQSFSVSNLLRLISVEDVIRFRLGSGRSKIKESVKTASELINQDDFEFRSLKKMHQAGSVAFAVTDFAEVIAVRKAANNICRVLSIRTDDRHSVVSAVKTLCNEDGPFSVYKADIKGFFENIDRDSVVQYLLKEDLISQKTKDVLKSLISKVSPLLPHGVPRGLALSSVMAEYALREFDKKCRAIGDCYYYSRYVDDFIMFFSSRQDSPKNELEKLLPFDLKLNEDKTAFVVVNSKGSCVSVASKFSHLGYEFRFDTSTINPAKPRVGLSVKRLKRIKTRVVLALLKYAKDKNYLNLRDRFLFLGSNYVLRSGSHGGKLYTGIHYANKHLDESEIEDLREVDKFIASCVWSTRGTLGKKLAGHLTEDQKRELSSISMAKGHLLKKYRRFDKDRIKEIAEVWKRG